MAASRYTATTTCQGHSWLSLEFLRECEQAGRNRTARAKRLD
jgi:hypothetical protein